MGADHALLQQISHRHGHETALVSPTERLTYHELWREVERLKTNELLATYQESGTRSGHVVGVQVESARICIPLLWTLFQLQAPACLISHRFPSDMTRTLLRNVGATALAIAPQSVDPTPQLMPLDHADAVTPPSGLATILFSSGSSGRPKAVAHSLAAHVANAQGSQDNLPLQPGDRWLLSLPLFHVAGIGILVRCALAGATVVIPDPKQPLLKAIEAHQVTHLSLVPTQLHRLVRDHHVAPKSLKAVLLGGSRWHDGLVEQAYDLNWPVRTTYGLTEAASQVTALPAHAPPAKIATSGQVLPGRELRIDANGEILVRGETMLRGYLQPDGKLQSPFDDDQWFHTGDCGQLDDEGYLSVTGRLDQMMISGGENIFPEEIEAELLQCPGIVRATVVSVPDAEFGERPVALVEAERFDEIAWRRLLAERLPRFKIPDHFLTLPAHATHSLKPNRKELAAWARRQLNRHR